jgi:hypothetical protein
MSRSELLLIHLRVIMKDGQWVWGLYRGDSLLLTFLLKDRARAVTSAMFLRAEEAA